jgi:outer membrane protein TolC
VTLPLFDGGRRAAGEAAARAAYDDAVVQLRGALRGAVREVEDALVALQSTAAREADVGIATEGFAASLAAAEARWRGGVGSLFELEDARRSALAAQSALVELRRERATAWINLYRALGGGFEPDRTASR